MAHVQKQTKLCSKRIQALDPDQKRQLALMKEKKETSRFLMPDAPAMKFRKRKASPQWISCPLLIGTPSTPPPKVARYWERDKANQPPLNDKANLIVQPNEMEGLEVVKAEIEFSGFTPNIACSKQSSPCPDPIPSPAIFLELGQAGLAALIQWFWLTFQCNYQPYVEGIRVVKEAKIAYHDVSRDVTDIRSLFYYKAGYQIVRPNTEDSAILIYIKQNNQYLGYFNQ